MVLPLWNTWYFFALYAGQVGQSGYVTGGVDLDGASLFAKRGGLHVMDRYVLARTKDLAETVAAQMDGYDITGACATIRDFLDVLTSWYLRASPTARRPPSTPWPPCCACSQRSWRRWPRW